MPEKLRVAVDRCTVPRKLYVEGDRCTVPRKLRVEVDRCAGKAVQLFVTQAFLARKQKTVRKVLETNQRG